MIVSVNFVWSEGTPENTQDESARAYIESFVNWVEQKLYDNKLFPVFEGKIFSSDSKY